MYLVTNVLDKPHWRAPTITYQEKETYFTAVLDLGDMFDGGGVPIDHYIIQLDNGTQLELQTPLTVLTSCTILHCQSTSQPTTVQDTVIHSHLTLSTIKVESNTSVIGNCTYFCSHIYYRFPGIQYSNRGGN